MAQSSEVIRVRSLENADLREVWEWRNDPEARKMFFSTDPVSWETHLAWYEKVSVDPHQNLYIAQTSDGRKIGYSRITVDPKDRSAEVSINMNPAERGKGFSADIIIGAVKNFRSKSDAKGLRIIARVKSNNPASVRCFEKSGFRIKETKDDVHHFELVD